MSADPNPELQRLGQCLQEARLQQGLSIEELAGRLNMGPEQLQHLEAADSSALPEPVFVIAQARRVACSLGVDIDGPILALRRSEGFAAARPNRDGPGSPPTASSSRPARHDRTRVPVRALGGLALAAGLVSGAVALQQRGLVPPLALPFPRQPAGLEPVGRPASPAAESSSAETSTAAVAGTATPAAALRLQARQPSWIEVRTSSGTSLFRGTLEGEQTFPLKDGELLVLAGRPDLVDVTVGGAQARPLGTIDKVTWHRFRAPAP
ncbi:MULTISPECIES: helix-turn-helix domain-containing protein [Aphanothece]|uniref:helix-turn-helix domain-containing protein n=1 Tax=Aphanothece TaxID=1121 RepID=UPI003985242E